MRKAAEAAQFSRTNALRILRTLGITEIESARIRTLIQSFPAESRKNAIKLLDQLKDLMRMGKQALRRQEMLEATQRQELEQAEIRVEEHVEAHVEIRIGDASRMLTEDLPGTVFNHSGKVIESTPVADEPTQPS